MTETAVQPKRTGLLIWLILSQLLAAASLLIWLLGAAMTIMSVDPDGGPAAWVFGVWCYPIFPLSMAIGSWVAYKRGKNWLAAILSGLTFLPIVLFFVILNLS